MVNETKIGLLKRKKRILKANGDSVKRVLDNIVTGMSKETVDRDIIVISQVLQKTGLLYLCFSKEQSKVIKQKLEMEVNKSSDDIVYHTLKTTDDILNTFFAFAAAMM